MHIQYYLIVDTYVNIYIYITGILRKMNKYIDKYIDRWIEIHSKYSIQPWNVIFRSTVPPVTESLFE